MIVPSLSAFTGAFLYFTVRTIIENRRGRPKLIKEYFPGDADKNMENGLIRKQGRILNDGAELKHLGFQTSVLEFKKKDLTQLERKEDCIFCGPNSPDLNHPNWFSVRFDFSIKGFTNDEFAILHAEILCFDVIRDDKELCGRTTVTYKELIELKEKNNNQISVKVPVYSHGQGIWQYQVRLANNFNCIIDNPAVDLFSIYFKKVSVYSVPDTKFQN